MEKTYLKEKARAGMETYLIEKGQSLDGEDQPQRERQELRRSKPTSKSKARARMEKTYLKEKGQSWMEKNYLKEKGQS